MEEISVTSKGLTDVDYNIDTLVRINSHTKDSVDKYNSEKNRVPDIYIQKEALINNKHPQRLFIFGESSFNVDEKIYDLIKVLWSNGIYTAYSCQGNSAATSNPTDSRNRAYICFLDKKSFIKFHSYKFTEQIRNHTYPYIVAKNDRFYYCSYDQAIEHPQESKYCIYFDHDMIDQLTKLIV